MPEQAPPPVRTPAYEQAMQDYQNENSHKLLRLLAGAEGNIKNGKVIYNQSFGGARFQVGGDHPRKIYGTNLKSDAAGPYQFLSTSWDERKKLLGVSKFTEKNQDLAALNAIRSRGVDPTKPITRGAIAKLSPEWASLPTLSGNSYYGQPVKNWKQLMGFYNSKDPDYARIEKAIKSPTGLADIYRDSNPNPKFTGPQELQIWNPKDWSKMLKIFQ